MKQLTYHEFFASIEDPTTRAAVKLAIERFQPTHVVAFVNQDMCSSQLGHTSYLCIGPNNTHKTLTEVEGQRLGALPSQFQYPDHYLACTPAMLDEPNRKEESKP